MEGLFYFVLFVLCADLKRNTFRDHSFIMLPGFIVRFIKLRKFLLLTVLGVFFLVKNIDNDLH